MYVKFKTNVMKIEEFELEYDFRGRGKETIYIECEVTIEENESDRESHCIGDNIISEDFADVRITKISEIEAWYYDEYDELKEIPRRAYPQLKEYLLYNYDLTEKL